MEPINNNRMETYTCHICFRVFKDKKALIFHVALHRRAKVIPINGLRIQPTKLHPNIIRPPQQIQYVLLKPQDIRQRNFQQQDLFLNQQKGKPNDVSSSSSSINNNINASGGDFNLKIINTVSLAEKQKEMIKNQVKEKDPLAVIAPTSKTINRSVKTLNLIKTAVSPIVKERTATTSLVRNTLLHNNNNNNGKKTKTNIKTKKNWFEEILKLSRNSDKLPNFGILCPDVEIDIDPQQDDDEQEPTFDQVIQSRRNSKSIKKNLHHKEEEEEDENEDEGFKGGVTEMDEEEEEDPVTQIITKLINHKTKNGSKQSLNLPSSSSSFPSSSLFYQKKITSPKEIINNKKQQQKQTMKKEKMNELNDIKPIKSEEMESTKRTKTRIIKTPLKLAEFFSSDFVSTDELEGINLKKKKSPTKNADLSFKRSPSIGIVSCPSPGCIRKFSTRGNMIRHMRINHP